MSKAELSRTIAAPMRTITKAIDALGAKDGDPPITWNKTRTVGRDVSDEGTVEVRLKRLDAKNTEVTIEISSDNPMVGMALSFIGPKALDEMFNELEAEIRTLNSGDRGL